MLSEGSANYGIDLAFPQAERLRFERDILYPLAGLDPASAEAYWQVQQATEALSGARLTTPLPDDVARHGSGPCRR